MESSMGKKWPALMALLLLSSLSMANSYSSFIECYHSCFVICIVKRPGGVSFYDCPSRCLHTCAAPANKRSKMTMPHQNQFFCKLGCSTSSCTKFSTKENPAEKEVGRCVDSCSQTCSLDY